MNIIDKLLGTGKAVEKGIDLISKAGDAAFYTKEEKANMVSKLYDSYLPRSLSRRFVAIVIVGIYAVAFFSGLLFACRSKDPLSAIIELAIALKLGILILSVVFFYFGYYGLEKMKK